jgi:hypothetical protein
LAKLSAAGRTNTVGRWSTQSHRTILKRILIECFFKTVLNLLTFEKEILHCLFCMEPCK